MTIRQDRPSDLFGPLQVLDHPQPRRGIIMGAIDAHAVHALLEQVMNEQVIVRGLARHGDHDADPAPAGCRTQQGFGVFGEQPLPACEIESGSLRRWRLPGALCQAVQDFQNRVDRGQDVRLSSPERGQPHFGQPELQWTEVASTEGQIMQEVPGACSDSLDELYSGGLLM